MWRARRLSHRLLSIALERKPHRPHLLRRVDNLVLLLIPRVRRHRACVNNHGEYSGKRKPARWGANARMNCRRSIRREFAARARRVAEAPGL